MALCLPPTRFLGSPVPRASLRVPASRALVSSSSRTRSDGKSGNRYVPSCSAQGAAEEARGKELPVVPVSSRRSILAAIGALGAASLVPGGAAWAEELALETSPKTVVLTGGNSGIGLAAARKLASAGHKIYLPCRSLAKAQAAEQEIKTALAGSGVEPFVVPMECDLSSLDSVRAFGRAWQALDAGPIDVLALNAGVQFAGEPAPRFSPDGYELTFATNHLGHFLLVNLLLPSISTSGSRGARIVITGSEVHDPASAGGAVGLGATLGSLGGLTSGPGFAMVDGGEWDGDKAYKDSKLCNILFARELERRLEASGLPVTVNTFGPGLITRTGLFRSQNPVFVGVFDFATNNIFRVAETVEGGGDCLVYMATSPALEGKGNLYLSNNIKGIGPTATHVFEVETPSSEAKNEQEAKALWELSAACVGLKA